MSSRCLSRVGAHRNAGLVPILGVTALLFGGVFVTTLEAQAISSPRSDKVLDSAILSNLTWRGIGPAVPSGRVNDFAVVESNTHIIYAATATGGAWKTINNGTFGGPSGTRHVAGITSADWFRTAGGDGFYTQVDPTDPTVVYCESQYGVLYPLIDISLEERRRWHDTLLTLTQMEAAVRAVISTAGEVKDRLTEVQDSLERHAEVPESLRHAARTLLAEADEILRQMSGGDTRGGAEQRRRMPIASQVTRLYSSMEAATALPTADQRRLILESREKLNEQVAKLNRLVREALPALNDQLTQHGVSWTPGRLIGLPPSTR